jgi:hypothetical protein
MEFTKCDRPNLSRYVHKVEVMMVWIEKSLYSIKVGRGLWSPSHCKTIHKKQRPIEELSCRRIDIKKQFKDNDQMKPNPNLDFYLTKTTIMWYKNIQIKIVLGLEKLTKWKFWWKRDIEANQMRFFNQRDWRCKEVIIPRRNFLTLLPNV